MALLGDRVQFVEVLVRQAHPGPGARHYVTFEEKMADAQRFQQEDDLPWPLLVDDLQGTVHQVYGGLADPTYLIDADGRAAFYNMWTYAPALHEAIQNLLGQGGRGVVGDGWDRRPRMGPPLPDGWRGLRRGWPQSFTDLTTAFPGSASMIWLGHQLRPLLAPLTLRARPLPAAAQFALVLGVLAVPVALRRAFNK
jgi:hypothetical protein